MLDVTGITKAFDDHPVLTGLDLHVERGDTVALLGASGSGKSTLLRIIAGLETPDAGRLALEGVDLRRVPPHRRGLGFMFQQHALFPHRDVAGNVAFGLRMLRWRGADIAARVAEVLDLVGLGGFDRRTVGSLSGGEAQRVALARALAPQPGLLLLDEPFGALDRNLRERLLTELRALFERLGLTVVAVTHDPSEAATLADQLAVLDGGRVRQTGPPASVLEHPATAPIARLLGHTNLVPGTARDGRVATAWGTIATGDAAGDRGDRGDRMVLVHPDGVVPDPDGPITATVTGVAYRGGDPRLRLAVDRAPEVEASRWPPLAPGTEVRFRLDPTRTVVLPPVTP